MTRLPTLGPRGEGWVALQGLLLVGSVAAGLLGPAWDGGARVASSAVGLLLMAAGVILAVRAVVDLRDGLTPFPRPRDNGRLIEVGAYRLVRHPIYGGMVLGASGWALLTASPAALLVAAGLLVLLDLKSRREEAWLAVRFPGYVGYRARTRRLFPLLY